MKTKTLYDYLFRLRPAALPELIPSGLYHYAREENGAHTRFHLRVDPDGSGMLLANATAAARLSPAGVLITKGLLENESEEALKEMAQQRFRSAPAEQVEADLEQVRTILQQLAAPGDNYPIINLTDAHFSPHEAQLFAPLEASAPLAAPEELAPLIDRLWEIGIPHVTFLAGEQPQAADLVRAVERAEDLGMIAGARGLALGLSQERLLTDLAMAGIDHITLLYAAADPEIHAALCGPSDHTAATALFQQIQQNEVCPVAEIPLLESTVDVLPATLNSLIELGLANFSFFAIAAPDEMPVETRQGALPAAALRQVAALVEELADDYQVRFIWQPPVARNPDLSLGEQVRQGPRCNGDAAVRVEVDGSVIPARGPYRSAGNLLQDSWQKIWQDDAFRAYRERVERPTHCDVCPGLAICAADCPANPEGWATGNG